MLMRYLVCCGLALGWLAAGVAAEKAEETKETTRQRVLAETTRLEPFDTDQGLEKLVKLPAGPGNAADHYAKLEMLYAQDKIDDKLHVGPNAKGIDEILAAVQIRDCRLTPEYYPYLDKGTNKQPDLIIFQAYLHGLLQRAEDLEQAGDLVGASRCYQAGLIWGWHFTTERPSLITFLIGLSVKARSALSYASFLGRNLNPEKSEAAREYGRYLLKIRKEVHLKSAVQLGDFDNFNCLYAAIRIAEQDQDPLWRQEAVLRLGVMRHGAPSRDLKYLDKNEYFQHLAEQALTRAAAKDPAPWIRQLAVWTVASITPERFRDIQKRNLFGHMTEEIDKEEQAEKAGQKTGK